MIVTEVVKKKFTTPSEEQKNKARDLIAKMRKDDEKLERGKFEFIDARGGWLEFNYRRYPGEPILKLKIFHGEVTDMPRGVIRHLRSCVHKVAKGQFDVNGKLQTQEVLSRVAFTPEF